VPLLEIIRLSIPDSPREEFSITVRVVATIAHYVGSLAGDLRLTRRIVVTRAVEIDHIAVLRIFEQRPRRRCRLGLGKGSAWMSSRWALGPRRLAAIPK